MCYTYSNPSAFVLEDEPDDSGSEQEGVPETYTKEEEENLLKSDSDDMDIDGESFHSAHSGTSPVKGQMGISRVYNMVRAAKLSAMPSRNLSSAGTLPLSPVGSLVDHKDARSSRSFTVNRFIARRNISASFDLETMKCITCQLKPNHIVLYKERNEQLNMNHYPAIFIICDQSFPANLPTGGEGECLKIIRVEDGSLDELTSVFLETIRPFTVPAGSVVLLHSLSHLAWVGAAAYTEDLVQSLQRITSGVSGIHGVPLLCSGSGNHSMVNDLKIVMDWSNAVQHPAERDSTAARLLAYNLITAASPMAAPEAGQPMALPSTTATAAMPHSTPAPGQPMAPECIVSSGSGQPMSLRSATMGPSGSPMAPLSCLPIAQGTSVNASTTTPSVIRLWLLSSLDSQKPEVFEAVVGLKCTLPEIDEGLERVIVEKLIAKLNSKFLAGLDKNFSTCRDEDVRKCDDD